MNKLKFKVGQTDLRRKEIKRIIFLEFENYYILIGANCIKLLKHMIFIIYRKQ